MDRVVSSLERRIESLTEACQNLEKQNKFLEDEVKVCYAKLENAQKNVDINKNIVTNALLAQNQMKEEYSQRIDELTAKLKAAQAALGE